MKILIYTPQIDGHYLEYIHHIYEYVLNDKNNQYIFAVPEAFNFKKNYFTWSYSDNILFEYLETKQCEKCINSGRLNYFYGGKLFAYVIRNTKCDEAIALTLIYVMPFVSFFLPYWNKCKISGIIYSLYPYSWNGLSVFNKLRTVFSYLLFSYCNRFKKIYILNSALIARYLNVKYKSDKFFYLTDPVAINESQCTNLRTVLSIPAKNKIILHFGSMSKAKGTIEILKTLSKHCELLEHYTFIFAGKITQAISLDFFNLLESIPDKRNIIIRDEFCSYELVQDLLYTSDAILIPYINSSQSSGVVAYGAYFKKPIIVLRDGFVGNIVKEYNLGICIKDNSEDSIYNAILQVDEYHYSPTKDYIKTHQIHQFCLTLLNEYK